MHRGVESNANEWTKEGDNSISKRELKIFYGVLALASSILGFAIGFGFAIGISQTSYWEWRYILFPILIMLAVIVLLVNNLIYGKKHRQWL